MDKLPGRVQSGRRGEIAQRQSTAEEVLRERIVKQEAASDAVNSVNSQNVAVQFNKSPYTEAR